MPIDWKTTKRPILALAPMADMTDSPFCNTVKYVIKKHINESRLIIFREMVSSEAVVRSNDKTILMTNFSDLERPIVQQIFGSNAQIMADAAKIIEETSKPDGIDINMGCPAYKITSGFNGAALMKDPDLAASIVKKVKSSINCQLSVKIRAGWSDHMECVNFSKIIEDAGADMITIHGRTKTQGYAGEPNREAVSAAKQSVSIPVLFNGNIFTPLDYFSAIKETSCDGAMIARGALGNPWIFTSIESSLYGDPPEMITLLERIDTIKYHLDLHIAYYGPKSTVTFRKHLPWYFKGVANIKPLKQQMMSQTEPDGLKAILDEISKMNSN